MTPLDPTTAALDARSRAQHPAWRAAVPGLLHAALARWPGHPELIDAVTDLADDGGFTEATQDALLPVLIEAASGLQRARAAPLHARAALLCWLYADTASALAHLVEALTGDPSCEDALLVLQEVAEDRACAPLVDDAMQTLALRVVRGDLDRTPVLACFDRVPLPLGRARMLLGA